MALMERRKDIYEEFNDKFWTTFWVSQIFFGRKHFLGKSTLFGKNKFWLNPDFCIQWSNLLGKSIFFGRKHLLVKSRFLYSMVRPIIRLFVKGTFVNYVTQQG